MAVMNHRETRGESFQKVKLDEGDPEDVFEIVLKLGEGSFGQVFQAKDKRTNEMVGLKVMPISAESGSLLKEVAIMRKCRSQYIVNFRGAFEKEDNIWLAMEYCAAGSVTDIIRATDQTMTEEQIQVIMRDSIHGLIYLHSQKLIHRDIKAGNILLNEQGQVKLADFGVSRALDNTMDKAKTQIGSPFWMAPELLEKDYDFKADIWSLGVTAIELAKGRPPNTEKAVLQVLFHIKDGPPPTLPEDEEWTEDLREFIASCCIKDPKKRSNARQLAQHRWMRAAPLQTQLITKPLVDGAIPKLEKWRAAEREREQAKAAEQDEYDVTYEQYDCDTMVTASSRGGTAGGAGTTQFGTTKYGTTEYGTTEMGTTQFGTTQFNTTEMGTTQFGTTEIGTTQFGTTEINTDTPASETVDLDKCTMITAGSIGSIRISTTYIESDEESDEDAGMGTRVIIDENAPLNSQTEPMPERFPDSIFENNPLIDKLLPIPRDASKSELNQLWQKVMSEKKRNSEKLDLFYRRHISEIQKRIQILQKSQK